MESYLCGCPVGVAQVPGLKSTVEGNERQTMVLSALSKSNLALPLVECGASSARWLGPKFWDLEKERSRTTLASRVRGWIRDVLLVGDGLLISIFLPVCSIFIKMRNGSSQSWV